MIHFKLNGLDAQVEEGTTILEACRFYGIEIPTLCYDDGLSPYGGCRLCVVEIGTGKDAKVVTSCTYPCEEGLEVRTHSERVEKDRKVLVELLLATAPRSRTIQDLAAAMGVLGTRFKPKDEECILCGLCTRICAEQMDARAIGFVNRGFQRKITTPFNIRSEACRLCWACIYICPACQLRCAGPEATSTVCGSCANLGTVCLDKYDDAMCYMDPCAACLKPIVDEEKKKKPERGLIQEDTTVSNSIRKSKGGR